MSIAAGIESGLDLDLSALEEQFTPPACESEHHGHEWCHADGGERYLLTLVDCPCKTRAGDIIIRCGTFVQAVAQYGVQCASCGQLWDFSQAYSDLGPVTP